MFVRSSAAVTADSFVSLFRLKAFKFQGASAAKVKLKVP